MNKTSRSFAGIILLFLLLSACGGNPGRVRELKERADSLAFVNEQQQMALDDMTEFVSELTSIMDTINAREGVLTLRVDENGRPLGKRRILQNLNQLEDILQEKREEISRLDSLLNLRTDEVRKLSALIRHLNAEIDEKDKTIRELRDELDAKDVRIRNLSDDVTHLNDRVENLNDNIGSLNDTITGMKQQQERASQEVSRMQTQLETAYYIAGTRKVLQQKGVVASSGRTRVTAGDMDLSQFERINRFYQKEIVFVGKNPKILTTPPPADTYTIIDGKNQVPSKILIHDPERFWSRANVLVIEVR